MEMHPTPGCPVRLAADPPPPRCPHKDPTPGRAWHRAWHSACARARRAQLGIPNQPPGRSPAVPAQTRTPRNASVPLAPFPSPPRRPVTLTGGLPGSCLWSVSRPRPPRCECLPRAGTGSRAGQVRVSASPHATRTPGPHALGQISTPAGCRCGRCCSACRPPAGPEGNPGPLTPRPGHLGAHDGGAVKWGRRPESREGSAHTVGKEDRRPVGSPRVRAPPGTPALVGPLPAAPDWR